MMNKDVELSFEEALYKLEEDILSDNFMKPSYSLDYGFYIIYVVMAFIAFVAIGYLFAVTHLSFTTFGQFAVWATCVFTATKMILDFANIVSKDRNRYREWNRMGSFHQKRKERIDKLKQEQEKESVQVHDTKGVHIDEQAS